MASTFIPEVPTEISIHEVGRYLVDSRYAVQEKHNGKQRSIIRSANDPNQPYCLNKQGERRELPGNLLHAIRSFPLKNFMIIGEQMPVTNEFIIFDTTFLGNDNLCNPLDLAPYEARIKLAEKYFRKNDWCRVTPTAYTEKAKIAMAQKLVAENAEGMMLKLRTAAYRQGQSGQHFKVKFVKTLDAVVMGFNREGKSSVDLGLFNHRGHIQRICGASIIGKPGNIRLGSVVEISYLYGTRDLHVVQPRITVVRDDKKPHECKLEQIIINRDMEG
jgi:hypothetical protein